jgi:hypothetical protein
MRTIEVASLIDVRVADADVAYLIARSVDGETLRLKIDAMTLDVLASKLAQVIDRHGRRDVEMVRLSFRLDSI